MAELPREEEREELDAVSKKSVVLSFQTGEHG